MDPRIALALALCALQLASAYAFAERRIGSTRLVPDELVQVRAFHWCRTGRTLYRVPSYNESIYGIEAQAFDLATGNRANLYRFDAFWRGCDDSDESRPCTITGEYYNFRWPGGYIERYATSGYITYGIRFVELLDCVQGLLKDPTKHFPPAPHGTAIALRGAALRVLGGDLFPIDVFSRSAADNWQVEDLRTIYVRPDVPLGSGVWKNVNGGWNPGSYRVFSFGVRTGADPMPYAQRAAFNPSNLTDLVTQCARIEFAALAIGPRGEARLVPRFEYEDGSSSTAYQLTMPHVEEIDPDGRGDEWAAILATEFSYALPPERLFGIDAGIPTGRGFHPHENTYHVLRGWREIMRAGLYDFGILVDDPDTAEPTFIAFSNVWFDGYRSNYGFGTDPYGKIERVLPRPGTQLSNATLRVRARVVDRPQYETPALLGEPIRLMRGLSAPSKPETSDPTPVGTCPYRNWDYWSKPYIPQWLCAMGGYRRSLAFGTGWIWEPIRDGLGRCIIVRTCGYVVSNRPEDDGGTWCRSRGVVSGGFWNEDDCRRDTTYTMDTLTYVGGDFDTNATLIHRPVRYNIDTGTYRSENSWGSLPTAAEVTPRRKNAEECSTDAPLYGTGVRVWTGTRCMHLADPFNAFPRISAYASVSPNEARGRIYAYRSKSIPQPKYLPYDVRYDSQY